MGQIIDTKTQMTFVEIEDWPNFVLAYILQRDILTLPPLARRTNLLCVCLTNNMSQ